MTKVLFRYGALILLLNVPCLVLSKVSAQTIPMQPQIPQGFVPAPQTPQTGNQVDKYGISLEVREQNRQRMIQLGQTPPPTEADIQKNLANQRKQANQVSQREKQMIYVYNLLAEDGRKASIHNSGRSYSGTFPFAARSGEAYNGSIGYYNTALSELSKMLSGEKTLDLKRAVYLVENTIIQNELSYSTYLKHLEKYKRLVKRVAKRYALDLSRPDQIHLAIGKLYSDTLVDYDGTVHYPLHYDFNDIYGEKDYSNTFVTKLMVSGSGQCKSLPLLYKLLADEFNVKSYLSFSPNHSFTKFQSESGDFYNFEATSGMLTSDSWITGSGFVSVEAIKNRIYTDTVNSKQIIAHLLTELAITFEDQFGYDDDFMGKCLQMGLKHYPNDIHAIMLLSNLATAYFDKAAFYSGYPPIEKLNQYPKLLKQYNDLFDLYELIDNLGYKPMPQQAYLNWLGQLEEEKRKAENQGYTIQLKAKTLD